LSPRLIFFALADPFEPDAHVRPFDVHIDLVLSPDAGHRFLCQQTSGMAVASVTTEFVDSGSRTVSFFGLDSGSWSGRTDRVMSGRD
jgi:hypothetical protein